jgi:hypothetical protein
MGHALTQQRLDMCTSGYMYENADEDTTGEASGKRSFDNLTKLAAELCQ